MSKKFFLICIFHCVIFLTSAQTTNEIIDSAIQKEKSCLFTEASVLYERILFDNHDQTNIDIAIDGKLRILKKSGQFPQAIKFLNAALQQLESDSIKCKYTQQLITCTYLNNNLDACLSLIETCKFYYPSFSNYSYLSYLKILCLNEKQKWNDASSLYQEIKKTTIESSFEIDSLYINQPKLKNPDKAAWLSTFVPGLGQLYAGKPLESLTALTLQVSALYFGLVNLQQQYYLSAWLVGGGLFGSFHFGGVRRAEELTKQYNSKKAAVYNQALRTALLKNMHEQK